MSAEDDIEALKKRTIEIEGIAMRTLEIAAQFETILDSCLIPDIFRARFRKLAGALFSIQMEEIDYVAKYKPLN